VQGTGTMAVAENSSSTWRHDFLLLLIFLEQLRLIHIASFATFIHLDNSNLPLIDFVSSRGIVLVRNLSSIWILRVGEDGKMEWSECWLGEE
jgi:hypothetical protein